MLYTLNLKCYASIALVLSCMIWYNFSAMESFHCVYIVFDVEFYNFHIDRINSTKLQKGGEAPGYDQHLLDVRP